MKGSSCLCHQPYKVIKMCLDTCTIEVCKLHCMNIDIFTIKIPLVTFLFILKGSSCLYHQPYKVIKMYLDTCTIEVKVWETHEWQVIAGWVS